MIILKPFTKKDINRLIPWIKNEMDFFQWTGLVFNWPLDKKQLEKHIIKSQSPKSNLFIYKALLSSQKVVGHVDIDHVDKTNHNGTIIRVLIRPDMRGKGYGKELMKNTLYVAFQILKLHRVELKVFDFNKRAKHIYEQIGFTNEGLSREVLLFNGKYWNLHVMSMLASEWQI